MFLQVVCEFQPHQKAPNHTLTLRWRRDAVSFGVGMPDPHGEPRWCLTMFLPSSEARYL